MALHRQRQAAGGGNPTLCESITAHVPTLANPPSIAWDAHILLKDAHILLKAMLPVGRGSRVLSSEDVVWTLLHVT